VVITFDVEKLEWFGYPGDFKDTITRFDTIYERDRHMDRHRMTT